MLFPCIICIHMKERNKNNFLKNWTISFFIEKIKLQYIIFFMCIQFLHYIYYNI